MHDWVEYTNPDKDADFYQVKVGDGNKVGIDSERLKKLLNFTTDSDLIDTLTSPPEIIKKDKKTLENFSRKKIHLGLKDINYLSHEALSAIECKRRDLLSLTIGSSLPTIKQGTIVKKEQQYFLCMQPLCDSVRIESCTNFIFLKINAPEEGKKFTHVLRDLQGDFVKFCIKPGSKDVHVFKLVPNELTNTVKAELDDGKYKVRYVKEGDQESFLTWFGELKTNVAQSIANNLAEQISRVGLDTNEWLRRH